ncbi:MAG: dihydrodipicolinate reductase [Deltaproteobacteria bacterium]|jgi:4-hydroxy-tetrahydrodipicolinate reductase|nr:dihydrodipicolinate reductase [Deltaproteobacteria bacterium]MBW2500382.1 dihydrodipicolinate reductase [Deltaproteobacteria bacterium]
MHRVIVWGTGFVGKAVLHSLIGHPEYEIVGVLVNDPAKEGRDVGELIGTRPLGLRATREIDATLALDADAVAYFGPNAMHAETNLSNIQKALRAGKNVVDTSMGVFQNPERVPDELRAPIERACQEGQTSFFSGGIDPGFANDLFPLTLLGLCGRVESVRTTEFIDGGSYPDQASLQMMGLQSAMDEPPLLDTPGMMTGIWGGPLYMIAGALGVEVEETREVYRRWGATEVIDFPFGRVVPGQCAAHRIELQGVVEGEPRIFIDHLHRLHPEAAPDWPRPQLDVVHANRIEIRGEPDILQETVLRDSRTGDGNAGGCLATGMRVFNAIPAVCASAPGIVSTLDLPLIAGHGGMRAGAEGATG